MERQGSKSALEQERARGSVDHRKHRAAAAQTDAAVRVSSLLTLVGVAGLMLAAKTIVAAAKLGETFKVGEMLKGIHQESGTRH